MTVAVLMCGIEYFAPSDSECIFRCFELPLLLLQTSCSGDEPSMKVRMLYGWVSVEVGLGAALTLSRPICNPIQKELEGPTKDRPAY